MIDLTEGKLSETLEYAKSIGDSTLRGCIEHLDEVDDNLKTETTITCDFAPRSFCFTRKKDNCFCGNGGIIFHSRKDGFGSGKEPTFSVSLDDSGKTRWEIHT